MSGELAVSYNLGMHVVDTRIWVCQVKLLTWFFAMCLFQVRSAHNWKLFRGALIGTVSPEHNICFGTFFFSRVPTRVLLAVETNGSFVSMVGSFKYNSLILTDFSAFAVVC